MLPDGERINAGSRAPRGPSRDGRRAVRSSGALSGRGRARLGALDRLSDADGEDAVAGTLTSLVTVVRRGEISGASNAEIDAYVCKALRNRALNVLRGRARRREVIAAVSEVPNPDQAGTPALEQVPDEAPSQAAQAIAAEQLGRAEKLLLSWSPEDRYLFI